MTSAPHLGIGTILSRVGHRLGSAPELLRQISAFGASLDPSLPWVVSLWFLGVLVFSARWFQGCRWLRRLKTREVEPLADPVWIATLERLKRRLRVARPVLLLRSALAEVPMVTGWLRPIILMPASTLTGLTPAQLETILAHELAHVRRYDGLVNTLQNLLETVMFYHPAVWWISGCAREEREHCCDELALQVCRDPKEYAQALLRLEELRDVPARLAFAASGGSLLQRIRHVLGTAPRVWPVTAREFGGLAMLALGCVLVLSGGAMLIVRGEFRARCLIRLEDPSLHRSTDPATASRPPDPSRLQTEVELIRTAPLLDPVIQSLDLAQRWGTEEAKLSLTDVRKRLRDHLTVHPVRGTTLFSLQVFDADAAFAARLANAIADSYLAVRTAERVRLCKTQIGAMERRLTEQESKVRAAQDKVDALSARLNLPPAVETETDAERSDPSETIRRIQGLRIESQAECARQEALLAKLKALDPDALAQALPSTGLNDSLLNSLLEQLNLAEQKETALAKDYGPDYLERKKTVSLIANLRLKVKERTEGILLGLTAKTESLKESLRELQTEITRTGETDVRRAQQLKPYWAARRDLQQQEQIRQVLYMKINLGEVEPAPSPRVEVVDPAVPDASPLALTRRRGAALTISGVLLGGLGLLMLRRNL
jgi:uncharacterized protein involved in exopolysaccharide biosynthesis